VCHDRDDSEDERFDDANACLHGVGWDEPCYACETDENPNV
jgi:hypothetical protein